jgi:hypothetical protein
MMLRVAGQEPSATMATLAALLLFMASNGAAYMGVLKAVADKKIIQMLLSMD